MYGLGGSIFPDHSLLCHEVLEDMTFSMKRNIIYENDIQFSVIVYNKIV